MIHVLFGEFVRKYSEPVCGLGERGTEEGDRFDNSFFRPDLGKALRVQHCDGILEPYIGGRRCSHSSTLRSVIPSPGGLIAEFLH